MGKYQEYEAEAATLEATGFNTWKPAEGESLTGKILTITPNSGKNKDSTLVELEDGDGVVHSVWLNTVLEGQFQRLGVGVGDVAAIRFLGRKQSQAGREFKDFATKVFEKARPDDIAF